jgi:hypothetical protein
MMQIEKEKEEESEVTSSVEVVYNFKPYKIIPSIFYLSLVMSLITGVTEFYIKGHIRWSIIYCLPLIALDRELINEKLLSFLKAYRKYKHCKIIVTSDGIRSKNQNQHSNDFLLWSDIASTHRQNGEIVLVRKGIEEQEIRLPDNECMTMISAQSSLLYSSLAHTITQFCPLPKEQMWQAREAEELSDPVPRCVSPLSNYQVFTYHTKQQRKEKATQYLSIIVGGILWTLFTTWMPAKILTGVVTVILCLVFAMIYQYRWGWCRRSQIEIDDMGIALVGPKGVRWNVPWFVIQGFGAGDKFALIEAKDGKIYRFPINTARWDQLVREIEERVLEQHPGKDKSASKSFFRIRGQMLAMKSKHKDSSIID